MPTNELKKEAAIPATSPKPENVPTNLKDDNGASEVLTIEDLQVDLDTIDMASVTGPRRDIGQASSKV